MQSNKYNQPMKKGWNHFQKFSNFSKSVIRISGIYTITIIYNIQFEFCQVWTQGANLMNHLGIKTNTSGAPPKRRKKSF